MRCTTRDPRQGLHRRCHILAGVGLLASTRTANFIASNVPGIRIPKAILAKLESSPKPLDTGIAITVDILRRMRAMEGLAGVHILFHPVRLNLLGDILAQAGLDTKESHRRPAAPKAMPPLAAAAGATVG